MNKYKIPIAFSIILFAFLTSSCNEQVTPPPPNDEPDTTSHDIIWEADTLGDWNSRLRAVWGSSPNNIWAAGWIVRGDWGTNLVHYDGEKWEDYDYFEAEFNGMFGLDSNNIWAVGNNLVVPRRDALVAHYDGFEWKTVYVDINLPSLRAVWASAPDDVFAVGSYGTIIHYNGSNWEVMQTGWNKNLYDVWGFGSNDVFACGGDTPAVGDTSKPLLLHYDGNTWTSLLDTVNYPERSIGTVWGSGPENVYFEGSYAEIGLYQGNITEGWNFVPIPDDNNAIRKVRGNSGNNIFAVGVYGIVVHYNGINWQMYPELLKEPGGPTFWDAMVFDNNVFIVGSEYNVLKGIVYKGTIKN